MEASPGHRLFRPGPLNTYTAYSIGSFVAWAVLWAILAATESKKTLGYIGLFEVNRDRVSGRSPDVIAGA